MENYFRPMNWPSLGILVMGTVLPLGCSKGVSPNVKFVLPNGYRGVFALKEDKAEGIDPDWDGNTAVFRIPMSGELKVKNLDALSEWHNTLAEFENGNPVPTVTSFSGRDWETTVVLRAGPTTGRGTSNGQYTPPIAYFIVGTEDQLRRFRETWKIWRETEGEGSGDR